jgi:IS5 family transposase
MEKPTEEQIRVRAYARAPGGLFVLHAKALPGNPYDGHTLGSIVDATEKLTGCAIERAYVDKGYRGHQTKSPHRVFISGQKRGVFGAIERELRRRSAIEPTIGHMKSDGHLGRCHLKGREGDAANVILTAVAQPSTCPRLAESFTGLSPDRTLVDRHRSSGAQTGFLTDD